MRVKSIDELKSYITEKVQESLREDVAINIKSTEHEMVEKKVYSVYPDPLIYEKRKEEDGLSDPDNMQVTVNGTVLTVKNITKPNWEYTERDNGIKSGYIRGGWYNAGYLSTDGCITRYPFDLVRLVEYGDAAAGGDNQYTHKHSKQPPAGPTFLLPRPFIAATKKKLPVASSM